MNRKLKIAIIVVLVLILAYTAFYFTEYRHAEKKATDLMNGTALKTPFPTSSAPNTAVISSRLQVF